MIVASVSAITVLENNQYPHGHGVVHLEFNTSLKTNTVILNIASHGNPLGTVKNPGFRNLPSEPLQSEPLEVGKHLRFPGKSISSWNWESLLSGQIVC